MKRAIPMTALLLCAGLAAVCVERRFVITSHIPGTPPDMDAGAVVYDEKDMPLSMSPADKQFTYYGKYRFRVVRDGFQTTIIEENVKAPWWAYPPLDFVSENLIPFVIRDVRRIHCELQPIQLMPAEAVREEGERRRSEGKGIGVPLSPRVPVQPQPMMPATP